MLDSDRVRRELQTARYGRSLVHQEETGSTNDDARAALAAGADSGHVIVADAQTAGRGSRGRTWTSPAGTDLYVSIIDRVPVAIADLPPLTLAVGLAVAETADALLAGRAPDSQVKWPNDVLIAGKKCAGVLIETNVGQHGSEGVVIGIGLNVNRAAFAPELEASATSLYLAQAQPTALDRELALCTLLRNVEHQVERFVAQGPAEIARALTPRLAYVGTQVTCNGERGWLRGVSETGALLLDTAHGLHSVYVGPIVPVP